MLVPARYHLVVTTATTAPTATAATTALTNRSAPLPPSPSSFIVRFEHACFWTASLIDHDDVMIPFQVEHVSFRAPVDVGALLRLHATVVLVQPDGKVQPDVMDVIRYNHM